MDRRTPPNDDAWLLSYAELITNLLIFFVMLLAAAELSKSKMQQISQQLSGQQDPMSLSSIEKEIKARIKEQGLENLIGTELTDDGLELSLNSGLVFDSGQAVILPQLEATVDSMLETLVPYGKRYDFAVEGHTDARPILPGGQYRSNWELSADRANAVRQRLEQVGIERRRIKVEGYADTKSLPESRLAGLNDDERLARHRRVVVRVY